MIPNHSLKVALQSLIYLALVFFLLREVEETTAIEECTGFDAPARALARGDYDFLIDHSTFHKRSNRRVVVVTLDPLMEPDEVISNLCEQREFTAHVIERLNDLNVAVIALDKIFGSKRCAGGDPGTSDLQGAVRRSRATIVRGIDTQIVPRGQLDDREYCLLLKGDANLALDVREDRRGLLRMDANTRLVPLRWPVRAFDEQLGDKRVQDLLTLSYVTARAAEPAAVPLSPGLV